MAKRVYFAFHYQDVIEFRANVVRKHNLIEGTEAAGYYDHSIWEAAKNTNPLALKRLINAELNQTSRTVVLIGSETWARRWVRYELMKSTERGNRLVGVHINSIKGKDGGVKSLGPNPLENLGLEISPDGTRGSPTEWKDGKWVYYADLEPFAISQQPEANRGQHLRLSFWFPTYDWANEGYSNFNTWIA